MPRLTDLPCVLKREGVWTFGWRVWDQINKDRLPVWASALAYAWLFSIFPFIIFLLTLVPHLPIDRETVTKRVDQTLKAVLPNEAATTLTANVQQVLHEQSPRIMSVGIVLAIWAASGGMATTMSALNRCYEVDEDPPIYKSRPIAIVLTVVVATLILAVLVLLPLGSALTQWVISHGSVLVIGERRFHFSWGLLLMWQIARYALAILLMLSVVTIVYHFGTSAKVRFRFLTPGGLLAIVCWIALGYLVRLYVDNFGMYNKTYGTVGGVVVLLLVFYLDALILLVGAEVNAEIDYAMTAVPMDGAVGAPKGDLVEVPEGRATPKVGGVS
jgi:membrane protein